MRSSSVHAPDGMTTISDRQTTPASADPRRSRSAPDDRLEVVIAHERQDDGLVHAHLWARSTD